MIYLRLNRLLKNSPRCYKMLLFQLMAYLWMQTQDRSPLRFDSESLHQLCHQKQIIANIAPNIRNTTDDNWSRIMDEELYKQRYYIERTNAWIDSYRSLLNRFDTTLTSWMGFNFIAFIIMAIKKIKKSRWLHSIKTAKVFISTEEFTMDSRSCNDK